MPKNFAFFHKPLDKFSFKFDNTEINCQEIFPASFKNIEKIQKIQSRHLKNIRARHPYYNKLFVAVDFTAFGSQSKVVSEARRKASLLLKHLNELFDNMVFLQPQFYNIKDKGAVAIVEMALLISGKQLFLTGGGSFEYTIRGLFIKRRPFSYDKLHAVCMW